MFARRHAILVFLLRIKLVIAGIDTMNGLTALNRYVNLVPVSSGPTSERTKSEMKELPLGLIL